MKFFIICMISICMVSAHVMSCLGYSLVLILFLKWSSINILPFLSRMKFFLLLLVLVFITRSLTIPGDVLIRFLGLSVTLEGVQNGFSTAFKFFLVMITGLLFALTTRPSEIKHAAQWYLRPVPFIPEKRVAVMISLALSFMPVILKQFQKISEAQAARCADLEKNPVKKAVRVVFPVLKKTFLSADHLVSAMESRCYTDDRTDPEFTRSDREWPFLIAGIALSAGLVFV